MSSSSLVIIGAGLAGLLSAALAVARGVSVTVIEAGREVGGLWQSNEHDLGNKRFVLDAGLRLPVATGIAKLDDPIFYRRDFKFEWHRLSGWPREGAITADAFNPESSCIDATRLGNRVEQVIAELRRPEPEGLPKSAQEANEAWFGPTLSQTLARDALWGIFQQDPASLAPEASFWFLPRRVLLGDPDRTTNLLADARLEGHVAHARHADLPPTARQFLYPSRGGISTWIAELKSCLERSGVKFVLYDGVANALLNRNGQIGAVRLQSGHSIACNAVISTIAPGIIGRALGAPAEAPPLMRHLCITHVLIDRAPKHRARYVLNFSREARFFRAIFHDNAEFSGEDAHIVTFEHIVDRLDLSELATSALDECRRSGALPYDTKLLGCSNETFRNALPVPTVVAAQAAARLSGTLEPISNLKFVGRSGGRAAFLDSIIREAYSKLESLGELGYLPVHGSNPTD